MKRTFTLFFVCILICSAVNAQLPVMQQKAIVLKRMIELNHLAPRPVEDSFSVAMFRAIINNADGRRLLFTEPEFKSLQAFSAKLDDELKGGEWRFYDLFARLYKKALLRADSIINKHTQKPFDFTVSESVSLQKKDAFSFATDIPALAARWMRSMKFRALGRMFDEANADSTGKTSLKKIIDQSEAATREWLKKAETRMLKRITADGTDNHITDIYLDAIATGFDPHTNYFSIQANRDFSESVSSEALSLGLGLDEDEDGHIVIDQLTPGGPGWKSGDLNNGDVLLGVIWEGKENTDVSAATLEEAYEELDNRSGDKVMLKVQKADGTIKQVMLRKEKIENEENIVKGFVLQGEKKIGYILLPGFYTDWGNDGGSGCANDVAKEIVKLKKENIDGLILDVRFNGGGSLGEALEMLGIFIDEGPLVGIQSKEPKISFLKDPNRGTIYNGPMALMVNGQSASASELLAATLQDYNRAVIVGSPTFGKATMQQVYAMDTNAKNKEATGANNEAVKITGGKLYRVTGATAQRNGVIPDVVLPDAFDAMEYREKSYPNPLGNEPVAKNNYYKPLAALPVADLAAKSAARIKTDKNFNDIKKIISLMTERMQGTEKMSIKWDEYEKWAKQRAKDEETLKGEGVAAGKTYKVDNHSLDKALLVNNEFAKEINSSWLESIAEDIYIQEAFLVLSDLIKLQ
jgi:carboxyl-terminal processing protease